jgi:hypothetical protein
MVIMAIDATKEDRNPVDRDVALLQLDTPEANTLV